MEAIGNFCLKCCNAEVFCLKDDTLVKSSRIYKGQYTITILLLNDGKMLREHK